jgi:hypothetical protein
LGIRLKYGDVENFVHNVGITFTPFEYQPARLSSCAVASPNTGCGTSGKHAASSSRDPAIRACNARIANPGPAS